MIHLSFWFRAQFWVGLTLVLLFAFNGLMLGFLSLYLMQTLVAELYGRWVGWLFVLATAALSSVGVYIGRFMRFNSWDVVLRPKRLYNGVSNWMDSTLVNHSATEFLVFFATFLFVAYTMLYALTHLSPVRSVTTTVEQK